MRRHRRRAWSAGILFGEGARNLLSRPLRSLLLCASILFLLGSLAEAEVAEVDRALALHDELLRRGSHVLVVAALDRDQGPQVPVITCAALEGLPQVIAAGGLGQGQVVDLAEAPGTPFRLFTGSGNIVAVLDPAGTVPDRADLHVAQAAARQVGVGTGGSVSLAGATHRVQVFDPSTRLPQGSLMLLSSGWSSVTDSCWFEVLPGSVPSATAVARALFSSPTVALNVGPLLADGSDPVEQYRSRSTRLLWLAGAAFVMMTGTMVSLTGRKDNALYRSLGASRLEAAMIGTAEFSLLGASAVCGAGAAVVLRNGDAAPAALGSGLAALAAAYGVGLGGVVVAHLLMSWGRGVDQLKDRGG